MRLEGVVLRGDLALEAVADERDLGGDVLADPGHVGEDEQGEEAEGAADAGRLDETRRRSSAV